MPYGYPNYLYNPPGYNPPGYNPPGGYYNPLGGYYCPQCGRFHPYYRAYGYCPWCGYGLAFLGGFLLGGLLL
jgi:hypothetical protein